MKTFTLPGVAAGVLACGLSLAAQTTQAPPKPAPPAAPAPKPAMAVAHKTEPPAADAQPDIVKTYCIGCHNDKGKDRAGSLTLASFDASHPEQQPETAEKVVRKLRLGMMPPPGARRPEPAVLQQFATSLENKEAGMFFLGTFVAQNSTDPAYLDDLDFFNYPEFDPAIGAGRSTHRI